MEKLLVRSLGAKECSSRKCFPIDDDGFLCSSTRWCKCRRVKPTTRRQSRLRVLMPLIIRDITKIQKQHPTWVRGIYKCWKQVKQALRQSTQLATWSNIYTKARPPLIYPKLNIYLSKGTKPSKTPAPLSVLLPRMHR